MRELPAGLVGQLAACGQERARALEKARPHLEHADKALELGASLVQNAVAGGEEINLRAAAAELGVSRQTLYTRMKKSAHVPRMGI